MTLIREMENPNLFGCFAKRRFNKVDFPEPEGPEITIGRKPISSACPGYVAKTYLASKHFAQSETLGGLNDQDSVSSARL